MDYQSYTRLFGLIGYPLSHSFSKKYFGETKVNKSLRHNIIPCNEAVKNIVAHKINLFMNKERVKV